MPTNDFLPYISHHGILGQKWGVRRYQNTDGSLTNAGQKRYGGSGNSNKKKILKKVAIGVGIAAVVAGVAAVGIHQAKNGNFQEVKSFIANKKAELIKPIKTTETELAKQLKARQNLIDVVSDVDRRHAQGKTLCDKMAKIPLSEIGNKQEIIAKGQKIFRTADFADGVSSEILSGKGHLYVNKNVQDHTRYALLLANYTGNPNRHSLVYKTKKQLTVPSERQQLLTFMTMLNDQGFRERYFGPYANDVIDRKQIRKYYPTFMRQLGSDSQLAAEYSSALKARGYEAIRDHMDRGNFSETATIILNPDKNLKLVKSKKLTDNMKLTMALKVKTLSEQVGDT